MDSPDRDMFCIDSGASINLSQWRNYPSYYPEWGSSRLPIAQISYAELDHIIYFSIAVNADGSLDLSSINITNLDLLTSAAQSNGVKLSICVGGWGKSAHFSAMAANPTTRGNFVANIIQFCLDHSLDGVDLDWEPVSTAADRNNYTRLIEETKVALLPHDLSLSVAVAAWGSEFNASAISSIDRLHIMAYDMGVPHSSYADAISSLNHWDSFGFSNDSMYLGVPFYGKDSQTAHTYKDIMDTYAPGPEVDLVGGINFNGIDTIKGKTQYAIGNSYAGIMIWEISQDRSGSSSLLTAINEVIAESPANRLSAMIPPTDLFATASSGNTITAYADPQVVINSIGMTSPTAHASDGGSWFSDSSDVNRWIAIELPDEYPLDHLKVFNANEGWGWNAYGFRDIQIWTSTVTTPGNPVDNPTNWTLAVSTTLAQAPGIEGYDNPTIIDAKGHRANHVAIRALNTYSSANNMAGLSEVQIFYSILTADIDGNGQIDFIDFTRLAQDWLTDTATPADLNSDSKVDLEDLAIFAQQYVNQ